MTEAAMRSAPFRFSSVPAEPWIYVGALGIVELIADLWQPVLGIWLHAALAAILILRGSRSIASPVGQLFLASSVMPLVRIVSFAISPHFVPGIWYYVAAETPVMAAALSASRVMELPWSAIGIQRPRSLIGTGLILLSGVAAGWIERFVIHPPALATGFSPEQLWLPALLLVTCTGLVEEIVFRGLIQHTATWCLGVLPGITYTALGWAVLHIGWHSALDVLYVFVVGLIWGAARQWNRSTIDLGIAHGLANVMLFLVLPHVA